MSVRYGIGLPRGFLRTVAGEDPFQGPVGVALTPMTTIPSPPPYRDCVASGVVIGCLIPNRRHKFDVKESFQRR